MKITLESLEKMTPAALANLPERDQREAETIINEVGDRALGLLKGRYRMAGAQNQFFPRHPNRQVTQEEMDAIAFIKKWYDDAALLKWRAVLNDAPLRMFPTSEATPPPPPPDCRPSIYRKTLKLGANRPLNTWGNK